MAQVLRIHDLPSDIVTDRGPQFFSQVWLVFRTTLGSMVSLTSGIHRQTNWQRGPTRN